MKRLLTVLSLVFMSTAFAADDRFKNADEQCARAHLRVDALLQFFYKFEGNLQPIKDSKIKSLKYQIEQFSNINNSIAERKKIFGELQNDADYYQFLLQEKSLSLIKDIEELKEKSSPTKDKNLILSLPQVSSFGDYQNPYLKIKKWLGIQSNTRDFFEELENSKLRLEQLKQEHRLNKSLNYDAYNLGFIIAINKTAIDNLITFTLALLESARISK